MRWRAFSPATRLVAPAAQPPVRQPSTPPTMHFLCVRNRVRIKTAQVAVSSETWSAGTSTSSPARLTPRSARIPFGASRLLYPQACSPLATPVMVPLATVWARAVARWRAFAFLPRPSSSLPCIRWACVRWFAHPLRRRQSTCSNISRRTSAWRWQQHRTKTRPSSLTTPSMRPSTECCSRCAPTGSSSASTNSRPCATACSRNSWTHSSTRPPSSCAYSPLCARPTRRLPTRTLLHSWRCSQARSSTWPTSSARVSSHEPGSIDSPAF